MNEPRLPFLGRSDPDRNATVHAKLGVLLCAGSLVSLLLLAPPAIASAASPIRLKPSVPPKPRVGAIWNLDVVVRRDAGDTPGPTTIDVQLFSAAHQRLDVTAERQSTRAGQTGEDVYEANIAFPSAGSWTYRISAAQTTLTSSAPITIGPPESPSSTWKLAAFVASGIALAALALLVARPRRRPAAPPARTEAPPEPRAPPPPAAAPDDEAREDREALIRSCVYLYDIVREPALRDRLRDALAEAGVTEVDSVGGAFDPGKHKATGRVPTDNPSLDGRIAEVERPGFADRGRLFRLPEVTVYSATTREPSG